LVASRISSQRSYAGFWHIASFRCDAEFGRYRAIADIDQAAPINLDLRVRAVAGAAQRDADPGKRPVESEALGTAKAKAGQMTG